MVSGHPLLGSFRSCKWPSGFDMSVSTPRPLSFSPHPFIGLHLFLLKYWPVWGSGEVANFHQGWAFRFYLLSPPCTVVVYPSQQISDIYTVSQYWLASSPIIHGQGSVTGACPGLAYTLHSALCSLNQPATLNANGQASHNHWTRARLAGGKLPEELLSAKALSLGSVLVASPCVVALPDQFSLQSVPVESGPTVHTDWHSDSEYRVKGWQATFTPLKPF